MLRTLLIGAVAIAAWDQGVAEHHKKIVRRAARRAYDAAIERLSQASRV